MNKRTDRILAGEYKVIENLEKDFVKFEIIKPSTSSDFGKTGVRKVFQNRGNNCVNFDHVLYIENRD